MKSLHDLVLRRTAQYGAALARIRSIIELIEELVLAGGGIGLFTGCAAGDSGSAVVVEVTDRP